MFPAETHALKRLISRGFTTGKTPKCTPAIARMQNKYYPGRDKCRSDSYHSRSSYENKEQEAELQAGPGDKDTHLDRSALGRYAQVVTSHCPSGLLLVLHGTVQAIMVLWLMSVITYEMCANVLSKGSSVRALLDLRQKRATSRYSKRPSALGFVQASVSKIFALAARMTLISSKMVFHHVLAFAQMLLAAWFSYIPWAVGEVADRFTTTLMSHTSRRSSSSQYSLQLLRSSSARKSTQDHRGRATPARRLYTREEDWFFKNYTCPFQDYRPWIYEALRKMLLRKHPIQDFAYSLFSLLVIPAPRNATKQDPENRKPCSGKSSRNGLLRRANPNMYQTQKSSLSLQDKMSLARERQKSEEALSSNLQALSATDDSDPLV